MKLKDDFFIIQSAQFDPQKIIVSLQLIEDHSVYKGHFPGQPVLPGVCMMQMIKEIIETQTGKHIKLIKADDIRFLQMVNPLESPLLKASLQYVVAEKIMNINETICFKMKASYSITH